MYGRKPTWDDLNKHFDITRHDTSGLDEVVHKTLASRTSDKKRILVVLDEPGTGKSTIIRRVAHTLTGTGKLVLVVRTPSKIDSAVAIECLTRVKGPVLLVVDGFADHVEQVRDLALDARTREKIVVLAAERGYRGDFVELVLSNPDILETMSLTPLTLSECGQLVERYRRFGLVGDAKAIHNPDSFARRLRGDPIAIAACRILNDFRPLDQIVASLWEASEQADRLPYVAVALAQHCYSVGLRYSLLQSVVGPKQSASRLFDERTPLVLATNVVDDDYVVPFNSIIGERVLQRVIKHDPGVLLDVFGRLAAFLAPHVNRQTLKRRTPEARLASRLFDVDKIVRPMLGARADELFLSAQPKWEWNSRYWEQRALLALESDLATGLQHARHAVSIEEHPHPLTTLGKILMRTMELVPAERQSAFEEALRVLEKSIKMEARWTRRTIHPFATLLSGAAKYIELGGRPSMDQEAKLREYAAESLEAFPGDPTIRVTLRRLEGLMS